MQLVIQILIHHFFYKAHSMMLWGLPVTFFLLRIAGQGIAVVENVAWFLYHFWSFWWHKSHDEMAQNANLCQSDLRELKIDTIACKKSVFLFPTCNKNKTLVFKN